MKQSLRDSMCLYVVTDRSWLNGRSLESVTEDILDNGATFLQLREKKLDDAKFLEEAMALSGLAKKKEIPFVVNDRVDIALKCNADGVHLGQKDIVNRDVRKEIGADKLLGISVDSVESALAAQEAGADYLGAGTIFATNTKADAELITLETLRDICRAVTIPVVVIGGINEETIGRLEGTGIDGVAVISVLYGAKDIKKATQNMKKLAQSVVE